MEAEETSQPGIEPRLHREAAFGPLWEAVWDRRPVTFAYRAVGRSEPQQRELEPWGVVNRHGRWYVADHDQARGAVRVFRLSRIEGRVEFSGPRGAVTRARRHRRAGTGTAEWDTQPGRAADRGAEDPGRDGVRARRRATREQPGSDGWDLVDVPFSDAGLVRRAHRLVRRGRGRQ